jgi:small subunit ribosomal protein S24e
MDDNDDDVFRVDGSANAHMHMHAHTQAFFPQDNSAPVTIRTRKFTVNRLLSRRQFIVDVIHPSRPPISRDELSEKLAKIYKAEKGLVVPFGFKTHFGGGRSTGFVLIYDSEESQKKFEPRYRLVRVSCPHPTLFLPHQPYNVHFIAVQAGLSPKVEKASRKLRKERKNRAKKVRLFASSSATALTTCPFSQFRGTKKSKAAEPPKKGK